MGLGKPNETDQYKVWAPGMSYADRVKNMTRDAYRNAQPDCDALGCHPRHPTGVDVTNFVLRMVDTIRDAASGRANKEKKATLP